MSSVLITASPGSTDYVGHRCYAAESDRVSKEGRTSVRDQTYFVQSIDSRESDGFLDVFVMVVNVFDYDDYDECDVTRFFREYVLTYERF